MPSVTLTQAQQIHDGIIAGSQTPDKTAAQIQQIINNHSDDSDLILLQEQISASFAQIALNTESASSG